VSRDLHPADGARYLLERIEVSSDGTSASYRASAYTPTDVATTMIVLHDDGQVVLAADAIAIEEPHWAAVQMFAKLTGRSVPSRRKEELPPWPARVLRWRGPGRGS
jgi:hypothetical protein